MHDAVKLLCIGQTVEARIFDITSASRALSNSVEVCASPWWVIGRLCAALLYCMQSGHAHNHVS